MCRWLAYQGNPIYLDQLVYQPEHSLVHQSIEARKAVTRVNADGFGLGWYTSAARQDNFMKCFRHGVTKTFVHWLITFVLTALWRTCVHQPARKFHAEIVTRLFWINGCFCITVRLASMKK